MRAKRARRGERALAAFSLLAYLFLYAPILVLVAFSFNAGRLTAEWTGFTLEWYARAARNPQILAALRNSLKVAFTATALATPSAPRPRSRSTATASAARPPSTASSPCPSSCPRS